MAAIARESIVSGVETVAHHVVTDAELRRLCAIYANLKDPVSADTLGADLTGFFVRTWHESHWAPRQQWLIVRLPLTQRR